MWSDTDTTSSFISLPSMSDFDIASDVSGDVLPFAEEPNPFQESARVKEARISVDDYINNEEWAAQTVSFVKSHYGALREFQVKTVPLYRKKFKNIKDFMASKGTIQDLILRGLPENVSVAYHTKEGNIKERNRALSKVAYYFMRIRDAVYPEENKDKRVKEWAAIAKREREMMDYMDSHREKIARVKEQEEEEDDEETIVTSASSTSAFVKSVKKDEDGIDYWITHYQTNYPDHYPQEELHSAIRDMWFEDTKPFVYRSKYLTDREDTIKISKCGFYLYDTKKKINIRRSSIPAALRAVFNDTITVIENDKFPKEQFSGNISVDYLKDGERVSVDEYDIMICNPPYSDKTSFLECAYKVGKFFCMLLPLDTLFSGQRMALFKTYGVEIFLIAPDATFIEGKTGREVKVRCGWFVWYPEMLSNPTIKIDYSIVGSKVSKTFMSFMSKYKIE